MQTTKCQDCGHEYPATLVQPCDLKHKTIYMCGVCALIRINAIHSAPKNLPFRGKLAREIFEESVMWRRQNNYPIPDYINEMVGV